LIGVAVLYNVRRGKTYFFTISKLQINNPIAFSPFFYSPIRKKIPVNGKLMVVPKR